MQRIFALSILVLSNPALSAGTDTDRIVAAMLGENQMIQNLRSLTDEVGGRPTGSAANLKSVDWALARFAERGVPAQKEAFTVPSLWLERQVKARVVGEVGFEVAAAAMPYSAATPQQGGRLAIVDLGAGTEADFQKAAGRARGKLALFHSEELKNLDDLFREYAEISKIQVRAEHAGVAGMLFMSSRPQNLLYRHNAAMGTTKPLPMLVVEREAALRIARLLEQGKALELEFGIDLELGGSYTSYNVIGEIKGSAEPEEVVVIGAHLDSWDLGTGALDNGCNVAMMIEIAAQIVKLGITPKRTLRFCLWNGEEQGMYGSFGYTKSHEAELDRHVMAMSIDIGSGKLEGFFVDGLPGLLERLEETLKPVNQFGPFTQIVAPIVGTDNYDFMLQGVANLVGNHASANYGPNYHARSDTFEKVDQEQLKLNSAVVAAVAYGFAEGSVSWGRRTHAQLEELVRTTDLAAQMESWGYLELWKNGQRGRK